MTYVLTLLILALVAAPFLAEARRIPMTRALRDAAPGDFAALPMGRTHFQWSGPSGGPVAVCVHGLTTPSYVFAGTRTALQGLGYRVLSYDLYGRGYSDRPFRSQTLDLFTRQLEALLAHEDVREPVVLIGFSMGGAIAARFASGLDDRLSAVVLVAPAGIAPVYDTWTDRLTKAPLIGDWLARVFGGIALRSELESDVQSATVIPDLKDRQIAETRIRGFLPAVLSSKRFALSETLEADHQAIAASGVPVLAIWGEADPVIPLSTIGKLAELNPAAHHVQIPDAGHGLLQTHPKQVAEALYGFLLPLKPQREDRGPPPGWVDEPSR